MSGAALTAMVSSTMMTGLIGVYVVIAGVSAWEGNYPRSLYWISAALLTVSILWGTR